jgi:hypothetical protein
MPILIEITAPAKSQSAIICIEYGALNNKEVNMPQFKNVEVASSEQVWSSPDGQRKIFKVTLKLDTGQTIAAKSYSDRLTPGWKGDIETYEKEGRNGPETFVKQAPKEDGPRNYGGSGSRSSSGNYQPKDEAAIKAMWAIGQAVSALKVPDAALDPQDVQAYATTLFAMVDKVKASGNADTNTDTVAAVDGDEDPNDLLKDIDDFMDKPWPNN